MLIMGNQEADDPAVRKGVVENLDNLIATAIESVKILIQKDKEKK